MKIWALEDPEMHYYLEKFYWMIEEDIPEIRAVAITAQGNDKIILIANKPDNIRQKTGRSP